MKKFLFALFPLLLIVLLSASPVAGQNIYTKLSSSDMLSIMKDAGYSVTLDGDGDGIWAIDGNKALVIRSSDGESITFRCSFTNSTGVTLEKINSWNDKKRFSRSYLDKDNDMVLSLDLDLAGGATKARITDFFLTCKVSLTAWKKHVSESGTASSSSSSGSSGNNSTSGSSSGGTRSGTTSSGVQYSTGVDMSAFDKPFRGCMAYVNSSQGLMYVVPIEGKEVTNKDATAVAAFQRCVPGGSYTKFEWLPGVSAQTVRETFKDNMKVVQQMTYKND